MFSRSILRRGVSPFVVFLRQTKGKFPMSQFADIKARAKAIGKAYRGLSAGEKSKLAAVAAKTALPKRKPKAPRKAGAYAKFVKANYSKVKSVAPAKRLAALAKLWKQRKGA